MSACPMPATEKGSIAWWRRLKRSLPTSRPQGAEVVDLDGPLLLAEDRAEGLTFEGSLIPPPRACALGIGNSPVYSGNSEL